MDNSTGAPGERYAAEYLETHGFKILERNFRCRYGEIDVVARNNSYLIFLEVKTRGENAISDPLEAISSAKQRKLIRAAECYLQGHPTALQPRFDAAAVRTRKGVPISIQYVKNAFTL